MGLRTSLRTVKLIGQAVGATATAIGAAWGLSPEIKAAWTAAGSVLAPYLAFLRPYSLLAGILSLALFLYLVVTLYNSWKHRNALMTTLENRLVADVLDNTGKKVVLRQSLHVRADVNDVEVFRHRLWGDGAHTPPTIRAEGYGFTVDPPIMQQGLHCYDLRFVPPLARGRKVWHYFESTLQDSFTASSEFLDHPVDYREKLLVMEIHFPKDRPPKTASAHVVQGLIKTKLDDITPDDIKEGRKRILWQMKNPEHGRAYRIEWEW